jgi:hypothetical protein
MNRAEQSLRRERRYFFGGRAIDAMCVPPAGVVAGVAIGQDGNALASKVHFDLGTVRRRVDDYSALALLARLENRESDVAMEIATSLSAALVRGASTDIVLDEGDRAELRRVLEGWSLEGEPPDELHWLYMALHRERLLWEAHLQGRSSVGSPGLGEASRTPFRRGSRVPERSSGTTPRR